VFKNPNTNVCKKRVWYVYTIGSVCLQKCFATIKQMFETLKQLFQNVNRSVTCFVTFMRSGRFHVSVRIRRFLVLYHKRFGTSTRLVRLAYTHVSVSLQMCFVTFTRVFCFVSFCFRKVDGTLKNYSGVYLLGVILYDPPPKFAVKTALWLIKPGTRDGTPWVRRRQEVKYNVRPFENSVFVIINN